VFNYTFHWRPVLNALPQLLQGAVVTIQIAVLSMIAGILLGIALASMRRSQSRILNAIAVTWIEVARNTPALFQIYMAYFGLGQIGIRLDSFIALLAGITFNNAGYLAETFRGGLRAVPETQTRAARSLGFSQFDAFRLIVLPQMFRAVYPAVTNQMVWAILMTSLGVVIGLNTDLTGVTNAFNVKTFRTFEYFAIAAVMYYLIAKLVMLAARLISWRLFRY
jgi:His/Glu/Gln/Arg/opine family amino acid ABC transporter permease subunit